MNLIVCYFVRYKDFVVQNISVRRNYDCKVEIEIFQAFQNKRTVSKQDYFLYILFEQETVGTMSHLMHSNKEIVIEIAIKEHTE